MAQFRPEWWLSLLRNGGSTPTGLAAHSEPENSREILRLKSLGFSERNIARSCSVSRNTVKRVTEKAQEKNISWPLDFDMTDKVLAWLIDITNCRTTYKRLLENRKTLLQNLYNTFDTSLQLIIYETAYYIHCIDSKKWYEWIESTNRLAVDNHDLIEDYNHSFIVFFDDIAEQIFAIKSQEAILLDAGIIQSEDVQALSTILSICDAAKALYQSTHDKTVCFSQFVTICRLLHKIISFAPSLRPINDLKIEPRLYIISLKDEIEEKE